MYSSDQDANSNNLTGYYWAQATPKTYANTVPLFCNGTRCKQRDWRHSRHAHRNQAHKWARATQHRLEQLDDTFTIATGCLKMPPNATLDDWRVAKSTFARYLRRWRQRTGYTFEFVAKQHVTINRGLDAVHYDWVVYHNIPRSDQWVRREILGLWRRAGGYDGSLTPMDSYLETASNYLYKFAPENSPHYQTYLRTFPLPATKLPVTWTSSGFWACKAQEFTIQSYFNDEFQTKIKRLSPIDQHWRAWRTKQLGDDIPRYETEDYRQSQRLPQELDAILHDPMRQPLQLAYSQKTRHNNEHNTTPKPPKTQAQMPKTAPSQIYQSYTDDRLDHHHVNRHGDYWICPVHRRGKPTGLYRLHFHDHRRELPGYLVANANRSEFTRPEATKIIAYMGWQLPGHWHD